MLKQLFNREPEPQTHQFHPAVMYDTALAQQDVQLTPAAEQKMQALMNAADEDFPGVRLFVMGGGCSGMEYSMTYAQEKTAFDAVLEGNGYKIVIDCVALNYLRGCTIDYVKQGLNESFVFKDVFKSIGGAGTCGGCGAAGGGAY